LAQQVVQGQALPAAVGAQGVAKTDGGPLFFEEGNRIVVESALLQEDGAPAARLCPLPPLGIPGTLHRALLGAVAPWDADTLRQWLHQLVGAELLYQRGVPPQATYVFKHALIQDAAYQSLLRSTRQQYHHQIVQVLEAQFPATVETQPELLAHHATEAGLTAQAVAYWQRAGQQAVECSAHLEAITHCTRGLALLQHLPDSSKRTQLELELQVTLGPPLSVMRGPTAPEVKQTYDRAQALCAQVGETPQLLPTLWGLSRFYRNQGALSMAREMGEQLVQLAERVTDPTYRLVAHDSLGDALFHLGEYATAAMHLEPAIALIDPTMQPVLALRHGLAPGVRCLTIAGLTLWCLGWPTQAVQRSQEAPT